MPRIRTSTVSRSHEIFRYTNKKANDVSENMTDSDSADDLLLLANKLTRAKSRLHSQEQAEYGRGTL